METTNTFDAKNYLKIREYFNEKSQMQEINDENVREHIKCLSSMGNPRKISKEIEFKSFYGLASELKKSKGLKTSVLETWDKREERQVNANSKNQNSKFYLSRFIKRSQKFTSSSEHDNLLLMHICL